MSFFRKKRIL